MIVTEAEIRDRALSEVVAALRTAEFPKNMAKFLRQCLPFDNFIVLAYCGERNPVVLYREFSDPVVYEAMDSEYLTTNYVFDPFYKAHIGGLKSGMHRLFDLAPDRFKQTSYFKLYYEKTTLIDEVAAFARTNTGLTVTACMGTDRSSGRLFNRKHLAVLKGHELVVASLMQHHWRDHKLFPDKTDVPNLPLVDRLRQTLKLTMGISLSKRQSEVALLILQGHSSNSISLALEVSTHTVKVFRRQLYAKCHISSQAELFAMILPMLSNKDT